MKNNKMKERKKVAGDFSIFICAAEKRVTNDRACGMVQNMKKIGLIGGTGPESTIIYYRELNRIIGEKTNGRAFPEITLESINLYQALGYCENENYEKLEKYLLEALCNLEKCGVELAALTAGTMHIVYDKLKQHSSVHLVSIPETASDEAVKRGCKKAGLLGTIFTMQKDYLKTAFIQRGIEVVVPSGEEMKLVNKRITEELEHGIVKESTRKELTEIISRMKKTEGIDAVILGCTELPLILNENNCPADCLDIMQIHIERLAELIVQ